MATTGKDTAKTEQKKSNLAIWLGQIMVKSHRGDHMQNCVSFLGGLEIHGIYHFR